MKILFTSVGRRVELIQMFRRAANKKNIYLCIYGTDISDTSPALAFCDRIIPTCRIQNPDYIDNLLDFCKREQIDALIPTIDTDLLPLSESKHLFEENGTIVMISSPDKIRVCHDKRLTTNYFLKCGLKSPIPVEDFKQYTDTFPCFIKPLNGSSSINAFKVNDYNELKEYAMKVSNYIVQKYIHGIEYTVDIFCDFNGKPIYITPRERIAVRSGEVIKTKICQDEKIISECNSLLSDFKPFGAITIQLIRQFETGDDYFIEINPRFGGGAPLSMKSGADSAEAFIRLLNGEGIDTIKHAAVDGKIYCRFDQSVPVHTKDSAKPKIDALIFDLDDTLYSEKEYVKSGFSAVSRLLTEVNNADEKLWSAFEKGFPAFDTVLREEACYSDELKCSCLSIYRNHKPKLSLYEGAKDLLLELRRNGIKTGIITDGRSEGQWAKIKSLEIEKLVDYIIVTDELGGISFRKPCDIAFRIMQRLLNLHFENMVYVGDNISKDFIAPQILGMHSVYFDNPDGLYSSKAFYSSNIYRIFNINELIPYLFGE